MRVELQDLQPQLIQTSVETKELIAIIEKETKEVEVVKQVRISPLFRVLEAPLDNARKQNAAEY